MQPRKTGKEKEKSSFSLISRMTRTRSSFTRSSGERIAPVSPAEGLIAYVSSTVK